MGRSEKSGLFFARSRLKLPGTRNPGLGFAIANIAAATTFTTASLMVHFGCVPGFVEVQSLP
jgi:hypothetical protein